MKYKTVIGLEIHSELNTDSKMFCSCANDPNEKRPNFNICPVCMGHPGTLPVINWEAVRKVIKTGIALNCHIPTSSKFDRKNYFYPDLPKGYQISQYDQPLCKEGFLEIDGPTGNPTISFEVNKKIRVTRIHLEEDTGRLIHDQGTDYSLVDLNRAGVPLMELVTEPDIETGEEARKFAEELQLILRYLGVSEANMEKGEMRVEVNLSLSKKEGILGTKVEVKNLNSFKAVEGAVNYEIERQTEILDKGEKIIQETRGWDDIKEKTISQRVKEEAHDYRYFPEPDLPNLNFTDEDIESIKAEIAELPQQKRMRFSEEYGLPENDINIFILKRDLAIFFENAMYELKVWLRAEGEKEITKERFYVLAKRASNYLITDFLGLIRDLSGSDAEAIFAGKRAEIKVSSENFAEFIKMIDLNQISSKAAKIVLQEIIRTGKDPSQIVEEQGLSQVSDSGEIEKAVNEAINDSKNQKAIQDFKSGKEGAIQFIVGQIMTQTKGKANPQMVREVLIGKLTNK